MSVQIEELKTAVRSQELKREVRKFGDEEIDVIFRKAIPPEENPESFPPLAPSVRTEDGILIERDVAVPMSDGTIIYTDIYRPEGAKNLPAIVAWSPYGKNYNFQRVEEEIPALAEGFPPRGAVSPWAKMEAPDPAYWCHYGYAVINPDARGAGNSEGDVAQWGRMIWT